VQTVTAGGTNSARESRMRLTPGGGVVAERYGTKSGRRRKRRRPKEYVEYAQVSP